MKQIIQLGQQLAAAWKEFGLNQKISVVTTATVVITFMIGLAFWSGRVDYGLLYGGLEGADAGKVIEVLDAAKVPYRLEGGGSIYVPKDKVHTMRIQLASQNVPSGGGVGLEIFGKSTIAMSEFAAKVNFQRAIQGELARTIVQMDRVESAEVMVVMPEHRILIDDTRRPTASVFVRARGKLPESTVRSIQSLVAHAVAGLEAAEVSVVDNSGNVLSGEKEDVIAGLTSTQLGIKQEVEHYLAQKAEGLLNTVLGVGRSVVRVSADLNFDQLSIQNETYDPTSQVMQSSMIDDQSVTTANASQEGGAVGVVPNASTGPRATNGVGGAVDGGVTTLKKMVKNEYAVSKILSNITINPGGLQNLSAAVFVAMRYSGEAPNRTPEPRSPGELDILRRSVVSALGIKADAQGALTNNITLEEIEFPAAVGGADLTPTAQPNYWLTQLPKLIYPGLAVGMFLIFLRMLKKTPMENIPIGVPVGQPERGNARPREGDGGVGEGDGGGDGERRKGLVTVDVFNQLVKENPNNMTQAIQSWLGQSSTSRN